MLEYIDIAHYTTESGQGLEGIQLSYEVAGCPLGTAPIVLVVHALTGNSHVAGPDGWWASLIDEGKAIDPRAYSILAFNIPGNGYDGREEPYAQGLVCRDVARLFLLGLEAIGVQSVYALIGASLGGGIAWQMAVLSPRLCRHFFAVATHWRTSPWLQGQTLLQERLLQHSPYPIEDARIHAMMLYRTPASLNERFDADRIAQSGGYDIRSWLSYHGDALRRRFSLSAYKVMNRLLGTIEVASSAVELSQIEGQIHLVCIDSDLIFTEAEILETYRSLILHKPDTTLGVIGSPHGHDAFLMDYDQLSAFVSPYFTSSN